MATLSAFPMVACTLLPATVGLVLALDISWRVGYLVPLSLIALAIAVIAGRSSVPDSADSEPIALGRLFRVPGVARRWAVLACGVLVEITVGTWASSIMVERGGASKSVAAALTVAFFAGMAVGRISLSKVLHRHASSRILTLSFVGVLVAFVPFLLGPGLLGRVFGLLLLGLTLSPAYPIAMAGLFELHDDTSALGRASAVAFGLGSFCGPVLLGGLSDIVGFGWAPLVLPVFALSGLIMTRPRVTRTSVTV